MSLISYKSSKQPHTTYSEKVKWRLKFAFNKYTSDSVYEFLRSGILNIYQKDLKDPINITLDDIKQKLLKYRYYFIHYMRNTKYNKEYINSENEQIYTYSGIDNINKDKSFNIWFIKTLNICPSSDYKETTISSIKILPEDIRELSGLETLIISNTKIETLPDLIPNTLKEVILKNNKIDYIPLTYDQLTTLSIKNEPLLQLLKIPIKKEIEIEPNSPTQLEKNVVINENYIFPSEANEVIIHDYEIKKFIELFHTILSNYKSNNELHSIELKDSIIPKYSTVKGGSFKSKYKKFKLFNTTYKKFKSFFIKKKRKHKYKTIKRKYYRTKRI